MSRKTVRVTFRYHETHMTSHENVPEGLHRETRIQSTVYAIALSAVYKTPLLIDQDRQCT